MVESCTRTRENIMDKLGSYAAVKTPEAIPYCQLKGPELVPHPQAPLRCTSKNNTDMRTGIKVSNAHLLSRRYIAIKTCMTIKCFPRQNLQHTVVVARAANVGIAAATRPNRLYDSFMAQMSVDARPTSMSRLFKRSSCYNVD